MTNLENLTVNDVLQSIADAAPALIVATSLGTFGIIGYFQADYYTTIFSDDFANSKWIGISIAVFTELVRFVLLISSVKDFSNNKRFQGILGLVASVGLVFHDIQTNKAIATVLEGIHSHYFSSILNFLVVLGLILEIRLILAISSSNKTTTRQKQDSSPTPSKLVKSKARLNGVNTVTTN